MMSNERETRSFNYKREQILTNGIIPPCFRVSKFAGNKKRIDYLRFLRREGKKKQGKRRKREDIDVMLHEGMKHAASITNERRSQPIMPSCFRVLKFLAHKARIEITVASSAEEEEPREKREREEIAGS